MSMRSGVVVLGVLALAASGCGSGKKTVVRTGGPVVTSTSPSGSTSSKRVQVVTITPDKGLRDGQTVVVEGTGFSPGEQLQVVECGQKHQQTAPGDCNLGGMASVTSDSAGRVRTSFKVLKGPFGTSGIVCSATQPCVIAVTQASLTPTEEDDALIRFAGS